MKAPHPAYKKSKISLATVLSGLVSLCVLVTIILVMFSAFQSSKQLMERTALSTNFSKASKMSDTLDALTKTIRLSLKYSVQRDQEGMWDGPNQAQRMNEDLNLMKHSSNFFNSIVVVDQHGMIRGATEGINNLINEPITSDSLKQALASKRSSISDPFFDERTGNLFIMVSEPLYDKNQQYKGFIGGSIYLKKNNVMNTIFEKNTNDFLESYLYLVDQQGNLLFHPDPMLVGRNISENMVVKKLMAGQSGSETVTNLDGSELLIGYANVKENGWGIVVATPVQSIKDQLFYHFKNVAITVAIPLLLLIFAVVILARSIANPFLRLSQFVSQLGDPGELSSWRKNHWIRETDLLIKSTINVGSLIQAQHHQLTKDAETDPLTGLMNRRTLIKFLTLWMEENLPFSIIIIDIDRFKRVNDKYGHQAGDAVLKQLAQTVIHAIRPEDIGYRYGGEELVILLQQTTLAEAYLVAEQLRMEVEGGVDPVVGRVTISQGVAQYPLHGTSPEELLQKADQALYQAKNAGRNQTIAADAEF
ncbi:diguanylate cyclase [Paenibacillus sp. FSL H8-0537]|uniref:sensor domain-containing diguanylate cyclase n=1 Tax=Paenibacillus sp. FSL H8-0537 TaxID=2921399 RepID=UPI003101AB16